MSVTPPPQYPTSPTSHPVNLSQSNPSEKQITSTTLPLQTISKDLNNALEEAQGEKIGVPSIKQQAKLVEQPTLVNVFNYTGAVFGDGEKYEQEDFLPSFPEISYEPLPLLPVTDRAFHASPTKTRLYNEIASQGGKLKYINPAIGVEIQGVSLKKLSDEARDDLALLLAERGVVVFRDQADMTIEDQADLGRHWGPLHIHATTGVPRRAGLEHVHVVYADRGALPDKTAFAATELYHSDVTYELQPPGPTILRLITAPSCGGDTLFSSGAAVYSNLSPGYQKYLEGLYAVHSGKEQAKGARGAGQHVRREAIETLHPVVRVNPVTGIKSVFVNPGFTRRIAGVSKAESDNVLQFLYQAFATNPDYTARVKWEVNDVAIWDNRVLNHSASFDFWPERRHALRITPHGEKPLSVEEYESQSGKKATDIETVRFAALGIKKPRPDMGVEKKERGFKD